jgi:hypothetical protein
MIIDKYILKILKFLILDFPYFHNQTEQEQIEFRECLLPFGVESFVFKFAIPKYKD